MSEEQVTQDTGKKTRSKTNVPDGNKLYVTTGKHTYPIDIQIRGEIISGQWSVGDGIVEFVVPNRLTEWFEKHYHFVTGNIVAA